jgi:hypothetical protein
MMERRGFLQGASISGGDARSVLSGEYEFGLFVGAWDDRAISVTGAGHLRIRNALLLSFASTDPEGKQRQHEEILREFLLACGANVDPIAAVTEDVESEWDRIWPAAKALLPSSGARCLIDLTACPRYYSLGLIAGLISEGRAESIDVFYAEGIYGGIQEPPNAEDVPFSIGRWSSLPIPFLEGQFKPSRPKLYVVSAGFEGNKTLRLLERDDPERIALIFPIPGVVPLYDDEVERRNRPILERFGMNRTEVMTAAAGDAIKVWSILNRRSVERDAEDVYYLCCGTKAHSLGLAMRALTVNRPTVLYNVPERHNFVPVRPGGTFWLYRLRDLSALPLGHSL